jgi:hypothetical protein
MLQYGVNGRNVDTLPLQSCSPATCKERSRLGVTLTVESACSPNPPPPLSPRSLPLPTMTQRFQLVTSPLNSCNPFEPRWVVGTQETHAAELHLRHSSIRHGITYRPFALGFSLLPQPSNAARPQVRNLSSGCFSPAAWRRPCFANRKSLTRGQPYGTFHDDPTACMMQELFHRLPNH